MSNSKQPFYNRLVNNEKTFKVLYFNDVMPIWGCMDPLPPTPLSRKSLFASPPSPLCHANCKVPFSLTHSKFNSDCNFPHKMVHIKGFLVDFLKTNKPTE